MESRGILLAFCLVFVGTSAMYSMNQVHTIAENIHHLADQYIGAGQDVDTVRSRLAEYANTNLDKLKQSNPMEDKLNAANAVKASTGVKQITAKVLQTAMKTKAQLMGSDFLHIMPKSKSKDLIDLVPASEYEAGGPVLSISNKFTTDAVHIAHPKDPQVFAASTCKHFHGKNVQISILLLNNQNWDPDNGIVYFYATAPVKLGENVTADKILCTNHQAKGPARPTCDILDWKIADDLHIHTMSGDVDDIAFTVVVEFMDPPKPPTYNATVEWTLSPDFVPFVFKPPKPVLFMTQTVQLNGKQKMEYKTNRIIKMTWCPNHRTGERYQITSSVMGATLQSSFTQYACRRLPCQIDSPEVFASNGRQLPLNILPMTTVSGDIIDLYVLVRCWGGEKDPKTGKCNGKFQYAATLSRL